MFKEENAPISAKRSFSICSISIFTAGMLSLAGGLLLSYLTAVLKNAGSPVVSSPLYRWGTQIILMYVIAFPAGMLLMKLVPKNRPYRQKLSFGRFLSAAAVCFPILTAGSLIGNILSSLLSGGAAENPVEELAADTSLMSVIVAVILAPVFEELFFRRFLIDRIAVYGEKTAMVFSALTFGLFHGNLFQFFYAAGIGALFAYIYIRTGKLRYSVILHMMINFIGSVLSPWVLSLNKAEGVGIFELLITGIYSASYIAMIAVGAIILFIRLRKLVFYETPLQLQPGTVFRTVCVNVGSILLCAYCVFCICINLMP